MGKKEKKVKKPLPEHTRESRKEFVDNIINKFKILGIYSMEYPAIKEMDNILSDYLETGQSHQGSIKFPESLDRKIEYLLSNKKHVDCFVNLKYIGKNK